MPKLLIKFFGDTGGDICELEEARYLFNFTDPIIVVDGQNVRTYDELVQIVAREKYRNQEFVEVMRIPPIEGG